MKAEMDVPFHLVESSLTTHFYEASIWASFRHGRLRYFDSCLLLFTTLIMGSIRSRIDRLAVADLVKENDQS